MTTNYQYGYGQRAMIGAESTYGVGVVPTKGLRITDLDIDAETKRLQRDDRLNTRTPESVDLGRRTVKFSLKSTMALNGTAANACDLDLLLCTLLTKTAIGATDVEANPAPTTTGCTVTTPANVAVGQLIGIPMSTGLLEVRRVATKSTAAITWVHPTSEAVGAGMTITASNLYTPTLANTNAVTINSFYDEVQENMVGATALTLQWDMDGGDYLKTQIDGEAADKCAMVGSVAIATEGGIDTDDLSFEISAADMAKIEFVDKGHLLCLVGTEIISISYIDRPTHTLGIGARGVFSTTPASHLAGAAVSSAALGLTGTFATAGEAPIGVQGYAWYNGAAIELSKATIKFDDGTTLRNDSFGSRSATGKTSGGKRNVTITLEGYLDSTYHPDNVISGSDNVLIQCGKTSGYTAAWYFGKVELVKDPKIQPAKDKETPITLELRAIWDGTNSEREMLFATM